MLLPFNSRHTGRTSPCILLYIPDGRTKEMPTAGSKHKESPAAKDTVSAKEVGFRCLLYYGVTHPTPEFLCRDVYLVHRQLMYIAACLK